MKKKTDLKTISLNIPRKLYDFTQKAAKEDYLPVSLYIVSLIKRAKDESIMKRN